MQEEGRRNYQAGLGGAVARTLWVTDRVCGREGGGIGPGALERWMVITNGPFDDEMLDVELLRIGWGTWGLTFVEW